MLAYTYVSPGRFELMEKPRPTLQDSRDAIVRVTLASICSSDLHIRRGSVPRAVPGITVGHEMVGVVEETGSRVTRIKPGDRVTVNVETFCGECYFCRHGWVNNCTDPNGGWALGCRIDGGQAEYVRVPYADQGLDRIPSSVTDEQALLVGDVLATGYWAAQIGNIGPEDTVLIIGAGPTGLCTLQCVLLKHPRRVIVCDADPLRLAFVRSHHPEVLTTPPESLEAFGASAFRPWRSGRGAGGGRHAGYLPHGMDLCQAQRHRDHRSPLRRPANAAAARYVRQKPDFQNRWGGWLPLRRNPASDRTGQDRYHAAHYSPLHACRH